LEFFSLEPKTLMNLTMWLYITFKFFKKHVLKRLIYFNIFLYGKKFKFQKIIVVTVFEILFCDVSKVNL
jgi:hypothetical protein